MARQRSYDSQWKEVKDINGHVLQIAYLTLVFRGLGILMFTWTTVVLLGGFVSMIDKKDFWNLTTITLLQVIWIDDNFGERLSSALGTLTSSIKVVKNILTCNSQLADNAHGDLPLRSVVPVPVSMVLSLVHNVVLCLCIMGAALFVAYGFIIITWISIDRLKERHHYGDKEEGRKNMDPAHNLLYAMCLVQFALLLYRVVLLILAQERVGRVSQAYGFQDNDQANGYFNDTMRRCLKNPSSASERNLVTYAAELMESNSPLGDSCLSGTLILDRLITRQHSNRIITAPGLIEEEEEMQKQQHLDLGDKTGAPLVKKDTAKKEGNKKRVERKKKRHQHQHQQTEEEIIVQQRQMIKRLIGSASSTHILQKLLQTLNLRNSSDRKMREAAARIVEHVADEIHLEQFPQGLQSIYSLINTFEEYRPLQPYQSSSKRKEATTTMTLRPPPSTKNTSSSESELEYSDSESESDNSMDRPSSSKGNRSKANPFHGYKELMLTGLGILWRLAGSEDNCAIISNTKHLISKIMAPISYDLVHFAGHSAWSNMVVERSLGVMLRLIVTAKADTRTNLCQQISTEGAITTIKKIVTCEECKGGELQMKAMQILTQLSMDETAHRSNLTKMLVSFFINGDSSNTSIRRTAGETLVVVFLGSKSVATLLPREENDEFVGDLAKILLQVGDDDTCRKSAAEILEHLCIQYDENGEYLSTLKNTITGVMPEVLREICHGSTGEVGKPEYARSDTDVESQGKTKRKKKNKKKNASPSPRQNQQHKLHVALLSLCVTACDKLHLDLNAISLGQATDPGECVAFSLAKKMMQLNRDLITADSLTAMKLTTRMVIAAMQKLKGHGASVERVNLESLIDSLSSISETMLDLEGFMVLAAGTTTTKPATVDTLDSLVKQARQLHGQMSSC